MIEGITSAINPVTGATTPAGGPTGPASMDETFGTLVRNAVEKLEKNQQQSEQEIARAVAGESPDLHRTIVTLQTTELNFQLALQVRNKVINAYEEIMRMQV